MGQATITLLEWIGGNLIYFGLLTLRRALWLMESGDAHEWALLANYIQTVSRASIEYNEALIARYSKGDAHGETR